MRSGVAFCHDEELATGRQQERFCVMCAVRALGVDHITTEGRRCIDVRFRHTIHADMRPRGVVVADIAHVEARASGAASDRHRFPILDARAVDP
jgi:hypothetical protein